MVTLIIASVGRRDILGDTLQSILERKTTPDRILVVGVDASDFPENSELLGHCEFHLSPNRGLTAQRNYGVGLLDIDCDYVVFLDDDMEVHNTFFQSVCSVFEQEPDVAAFSGNVLINTPMERTVARDIIDNCDIPDGMPHFGLLPRAWPGLYGCCMCVRKTVAQKEPFDEALPLYGLGEDMEIGFRYNKHGRVGGSARCVVGHLPANSGRVGEYLVGYSQVANYVHFWSKNIGYRFSDLIVQVGRSAAANSVYTVVPWLDNRTNVDRLGRLLGNFRALFDLATFRLSPRRIIDLKRQR